MKRYASLTAVPKLAGPVHLAVGMFDGVHRGHCEVIGGAVQMARQHGGVAGVLTFSPHPSRVLRPDQPVLQILDRERKACRIAALEADFLVEEPFTRGFAAEGAEGFLQKLCQAIPRLEAIHVGKNFRFGRNRTGDVSWLVTRGRELGLHVFSANAIEADGERISSTRIRRLLVAGEMETANALLGYNYLADGVVESGRALGRKLGFPTLNLVWAQELRPAFGVYAVRARRAGSAVWLPGVANYGVRPTVETAEDIVPKLETHLLVSGEEVCAAGLDAGSALEVEWLRFLRAEEKFAGVAELREKIAADVVAARIFLAEEIVATRRL